MQSQCATRELAFKKMSKIIQFYLYETLKKDTFLTSNMLVAHCGISQSQITFRQREGNRVESRPWQRISGLRSKTSD